MMKNILLFGSALFVLIIFGLFIFLRTATVTEPDAQFFDENLGIYHTIVVDMDGNGRLTKGTVLTGKDSVLAIDQNALPTTLPQNRTSTPNLFVFNGLGTLARFDLNQDNIIDSQDPVWPAITLIIFRGGNYSGVINAMDVGLRAIKINKTYLLYEVTDNPQRTTIQPASIVMADSEERQSIILDLETNLFER